MALEVVRKKPGPKPHEFRRGDTFTCPQCGEPALYYCGGMCRSCYISTEKYKITPENALKVLMAEYPQEYDEICKMSEEDIRTVAGQAVFILVDYVRDHRRYVEDQNAKIPSRLRRMKQQ